MFENIVNFFKNWNKKGEKNVINSKNAAKERLHLVLMQDRANVSADFLELMKQEIIEVIKKYIDVDESAIDVRLTNKENGDGTNGAPALYANIPILNIKNEARKVESLETEKTKKIEEENDKKVKKEKEKNIEDEKVDKKLEEKNNKDKTEKQVKDAKESSDSKKNNKEDKEKADTGKNKETKVKEEIKSENN